VTLGVGVTLLAGLLPAFSASRVAPLEALRPSIAETNQRTAGVGAVIGVCLIALAVLGLISGNMGLTALGGLMFLIGLVLVAPALVKPIASVFSALIAFTFAREGTGTLAQGNLTRQPARSAITASATMIGLAIIVGMGGMVWSLTGGFLDILQRSLGSDYLIMPPSVGVWGSDVGARQDLAENLRAVSGVGVVSTMRFAAATANGKSISLLGIDPEAYPQVASLTFQAGDSRTAYHELSNERTLIANGVFAAQAGLKVGDTVRLSTPTGQKEYQIVAIAGDYLNAKIMTAYISQANLQRDFRKSEDIFIQVNLAPGADQARVEQKMKAILEDYPQFKLVSGKGYFEENKQLFNSNFAIYFVLLGVLALPSLIALLNTLAIGVIERTREIGMLRAIGATRRQVRRMVIAESLLLAAIGTAFGLLAGLYLGYVMVLGLSVGGYPVTYAFPYAGLLAAIAIGLIFGVLAALVPARQAARMEIVHALRYE
jgi:putative ABC transport system permease protein